MKRTALPVVAALLAAAARASAAVPELSVAGEWDVRVILAEPKVDAVLRVSPPQAIEVRAEKVDALPVYRPEGGAWTFGTRLRAVVSQETSTPYLLDPASVVLRSGADEAAPVFRLHEDYELEPVWGTFGRLPAGHIAESATVYVSYRYTPQRLDSLVLKADGIVEWRAGEPRSSIPDVPAIAAGERRLGNVWFPRAAPKLAPEQLFPILEAAYPEPAKPSPSIAETALPKSMAKLRVGEPLRVLAWGDSVTDATYLPDPDKQRWQEQFVARLREHFPKSKIELVTVGWGGRNTASFLKEPPGSPHNYKEKVLDAKPDVVVSEFVNDSNLNPQAVEQRYGKLLADFAAIGAEWVILTPHYVRPDWMGLAREREIDDDPRPYVAGLREFAARHGVALADASRRYGRLWRQGLPYSALLMNSINHPDARGQKIFADALMELFP